jgi:hypothetical protein
VEIGEIFGVGYNNVSQVRKRLGRKLVHDGDGRRNIETINRKMTI